MTAAFLARLGVRLAFGEAYFWTNSYGDYYTLAENVLAGKKILHRHDLCLSAAALSFVPHAVGFGRKNYLLVIVPQAALEAGTAFLAFLIGRQIFNASAGILACAITAFYPYYLMHDTALQETGIVTFLTALSVWLLLRASQLDRDRDWFIAGLALGSIGLVRASVAPAAGVAVLWTLLWGAQGDLLARSRKCLMLLLAVTITVGPWLVRTYELTGEPVLNSQNGEALWTANNAETFSHYPDQSIDLSRREALTKLTPSDKAELKRLADNEILTSDWFADRAMQFIRANPGPVLRGALRKLEAGFSWRLNPDREPLAQAAYAASYVPVAILELVGMFLARQKRETILIAMLFLMFAVVTAVFWAHTSHRSYLDVYFIVFAASVLEGLRVNSFAAFRQQVQALRS